MIRLGHYKLTRPKEIAEDWVWLIDHTNQSGKEKCLLIVGVRLSQLPEAGKCLTYEDLEPLELFPVEQSNGEVVYQQLEKTIAKTGVPRAIVADHGSDLKSGIELFINRHPQTSYVYDIKHKTASLLKALLKDDEEWGEFTALAAKIKNQIKQTDLSHLAPPNQRSKARYMNLEKLIQWAMKLLYVFDQQKEEPSSDFKPEKLQEKLGWVLSYQNSIEQWNRYLQVAITAEILIREEGLHHGSAFELKRRFRQLPKDQQTLETQKKLITFVEQQSKQARQNERLVGSSEILESTFGTLKRLERDQAKSGITLLVLTSAAILAPTNAEVIRAAMETSSNQDVINWKLQNIPNSLQSKRRKIFQGYHQQKKQNQTRANSKKSILNTWRELGANVIKLIFKKEPLKPSKNKQPEPDHEEQKLSRKTRLG